jgi:hypothetical protein
MTMKMTTMTRMITMRMRMTIKKAHTPNIV